MSTPEQGGRKWLLLLVFCPIFLIGCWKAPFLACDDPDYLVFNPRLERNAPWSALLKFPEGDATEFYVPLLYISFRIERCIYEPLLSGIAGPNAWACGIRTTNLLVHIGFCLVIWRLLRRLKAGPNLAAFVVIVTAFHPIVCHSLCWCLEGKTMRAGILGFSALLIYVGAKGLRQRLCAVFVYALSLLMYPRAMGLLPVFICWEVLRRPVVPGTDSKDEESIQGVPPAMAILRLAPLVLITAVVVWVDLKWTNIPHVSRKPIGGSVWCAAMTDVPVLQRYIYNLLFPLKLAADYGIEGILSPGDPRLWTGLLALTLFAGTTFVLAGRSAWRMVLFGWLWFIGAMSPTLNFWGKHNLMTDNYVYFSMPGFFLVIGLALQGLLSCLKAQLNASEVLCRRAVQVPMCMAAIGLGVLSAKRSSLYADTFDLYENAVMTEPHCALSHLIFARLLRHRMDEQLAAGDAAAARISADREMSELEAGISSYNFYQTRLVTDPFIWLGRAYYEHGRYDEAIVQLMKARHSPQGIDDTRAVLVMHYLALILVEQKKYEQALELLTYSKGPDDSGLQIQRARAFDKMRTVFAASNDSRSRQCSQAAVESLKFIKPDDERFAQAQKMLHELEPAQ
jgi:tetratricopeptide (TPR) repeat protein